MKCQEKGNYHLHLQLTAWFLSLIGFSYLFSMWEFYRFSLSQWRCCFRKMDSIDRCRDVIGFHRLWISPIDYQYSNSFIRNINLFKDSDVFGVVVMGWEMESARYLKFASILGNGWKKTPRQRSISYNVLPPPQKADCRMGLSHRWEYYGIHSKVKSFSGEILLHCIYMYFENVCSSNGK